jgi:hypothetical protein
MPALTQALRSPAFIQSILLVLVIAVLAVVLVPPVKARMDQHRLRAERRFQAEVTRQEIVLESQAMLLDNVSELLWGLVTMALEVAYHKREPAGEQLAAEAFQLYNDQVWDYLAELRSEVSRAARLVSPQAAEQLDGVRQEWLDKAHMLLVKLARLEEASKEQWKSYDDYLLDEFSARVDSIIGAFAQETGLQVPLSPAE